MSIGRRALLKSSAALCAAAVLPRAADAQIRFDAQPGRWRNFQVVTRVEIPAAEGVSKAWIPVPAVNEPDWFRSLGNEWTSNGRASLVRDPKYPKYAAEMLLVEWAGEEAGQKDPLRHEDVVEGLEDLFVVEGVGVGLDGGEEGGVGPGLVVGEGC